jgi:hypothetical protein
VKRNRLLLLSIPLLGILALVWALTGPDTLQSDPAAPRVPDDYEKLLRPAMAATSSRQPELSDSITVTNIANSLVVSYPASSTEAGENSFPFKLHVAPDSQRLELGSGIISLDYIGVGYGKFESTDANTYETEAPPRFFDALLQPLTDQQLKAKLPQSWERKLRYRGIFPFVRLGFAMERLTNFKVLSARFFDARTHRPLTSGYGHSGSPVSRISIDCDLAMWHRGPVDVVLTIALGPVETFEIEPIAGKGVQYGLGELKVAAIAEGRSNGWSSSSDSRTNRITIHFSGDDRQKGTTIVFASSPQASSIPLDFEILDRNGKPLSSGGGGSSGTFLVTGANGPLAKVSRIRVKYYPNIHRLFFRLPSIPGLPAENDELKNLFDTKVPFARVQYEYQFGELIQGLVQMDILRSASLSNPPGYYPKIFTNTTAREILHEYLNLFPQRQQVRVDTNRQAIKIEDFYLRKWWQRVEQFVKDRL